MFYIEHNGCEPTGADESRIREAFLKAGQSEVEDPTYANTIVFLACTFTQERSDNFENRVKDLQTLNPGARMVVSGCFLDRGKKLPRVEYLRVTELVEALTASSNERGDKTDVVVGTNMPNYTIIPISEGCYSNCRYCSIKKVRGNHRSHPVESIIKVVESSIESGIHRIKLVGQEVCAYGRDIGFSLPKLIERIINVNKSKQVVVELGSMNPRWLSKYTDEELAALAQPHVVGNLHIALQSASDPVLLAMDRRYRFEDYLKVLDVLKKAGAKHFATDLIAAFPGETEEDHQMTLDHLKKQPYGFLQAFVYQERPGTPAEGETCVPHEVAVRRACELLACYSVTHAQSFSQPSEKIIDGTITIPYNTNIDFRHGTVA